MNLSILLKDYAIYNLWANTRIVEWLQSKPAELMEKEMPSSFPSVKLTLLHMWGAQDIWLQRLQGVSPMDFQSLGNGFKGTTQQVFDGLLRTSTAIRDFMHRQSEEYFAESTTYTHSNGNQYIQVNAEIIQHFLQHSAYHRGQIVTIARNLGLSDPPSTDFIVYIRGKVTV